MSLRDRLPQVGSWRRRGRPAAERLRAFATERPVLTVFCLLAAVPVVLAAFSYRPLVPVPAAVLGDLWVVFRVAVYLPVATIRTLAFDPVGLGWAFGVPVVGHLLTFGSLLAFYFGLSYVLVRGYRGARERAENRRFRS